MINLFNNVMTQKEKLQNMYWLIYRHGPVSKSDLVELSKLKQSTCSRLIEELSELDLIVSDGLGDSNGGRRPTMFKINSKFCYLIGIDISRTQTIILLMDLKLTIIEKKKIPMNEKSTPKFIINFLFNSINSFLNKHLIKQREILGIGISAVGPLDITQGTILNPVMYPAPGWQNIKIKEMFKENFSIPVTLENGANSAVLGEYWCGLWKKHNNIGYNIVGIGMRSAYLANGQVIDRTVDTQATFAHMVIDIHGRKCTCGGFGCINRYATITAIRDEVIKRLKRSQDSILFTKYSNVEEIRFTDICWAVNENDPLCCEIIRDAAFYYGVALTNIIYLTHPEMIILGGALISEVNLFYEVATKTALERINSTVRYEVKFSKGNLGENAVAVGAGAVILNQYFKMGT